jgi:hypothetical protein
MKNIYQTPFSSSEIKSMVAHRSISFYFSSFFSTKKNFIAQCFVLMQINYLYDDQQPKSIMRKKVKNEEKILKEKIKKNFR